MALMAIDPFSTWHVGDDLGLTVTCTCRADAESTLNTSPDHGVCILLESHHWELGLTGVFPTLLILLPS